MREKVHGPQFAEEARQELLTHLDPSYVDWREGKLCVRFAAARANVPHGLVNQEQELIYVYLLTCDIYVIYTAYNMLLFSQGDDAFSIK